MGDGSSRRDDFELVAQARGEDVLLRRSPVVAST
jgi:hypothetical protein